jgi:hypothetical protein
MAILEVAALGDRSVTLVLDGVGGRSAAVRSSYSASTLVDDDWSTTCSSR